MWEGTISTAVASSKARRNNVGITEATLTTTHAQVNNISAGKMLRSMTEREPKHRTSSHWRYCYQFATRAHSLIRSPVER